MALRCNCFVFSLLAWLRWRRRGAYWACRRSWHITGLHWLVHYRGRWIHYEPLRPQSRWWRAAVHKLWYRGRICRSDRWPDTTP